MGAPEAEVEWEPTGRQDKPERTADGKSCAGPRSNQATREEPVGTSGIQPCALVEHRDCGRKTAEEVEDVSVLATLAAKLEDTVRGVERLRAATAVVGQAKCAEICRTLNFPGDSLDDVPDRAELGN